MIDTIVYFASKRYGKGGIFEDIGKDVSRMLADCFGISEINIREFAGDYIATATIEFDMNRTEGSASVEAFLKKNGWKMMDRHEI